MFSVGRFASRPNMMNDALSSRVAWEIGQENESHRSLGKKPDEKWEKSGDAFDTAQIYKLK